MRGRSFSKAIRVWQAMWRMFSKVLPQPRKCEKPLDSSGFSKVNTREIPERSQTPFPIRAVVAVAATEVVHATLHHPVHAALHEVVARAVLAAS